MPHFGGIYANNDCCASGDRYGSPLRQQHSNSGHCHVPGGETTITHDLATVLLLVVPILCSGSQRRRPDDCCCEKRGLAAFLSRVPSAGSCVCLVPASRKCRV